MSRVRRCRLILRAVPSAGRVDVERGRPVEHGMTTALAPDSGRFDSGERRAASTVVPPRWWMVATTRDDLNKPLIGSFTVLGERSHVAAADDCA